MLSMNQHYVYSLHGGLGCVDYAGYPLGVHVIVGQLFRVGLGPSLRKQQAQPVAHFSRRLGLGTRKRWADGEGGGKKKKREKKAKGKTKARKWNGGETTQRDKKGCEG